jgi:hypothetical protein
VVTSNDSTIGSYLRLHRPSAITLLPLVLGCGSMVPLVAAKLKSAINRQRLIRAQLTITEYAY